MEIVGGTTGGSGRLPVRLDVAVAEALAVAPPGDEE
jgi:hypothetical protein